MADHISEPMLEMYIFETTQLMEQLEQVVLANEKSGFSQEDVNEIFRIMHTVKGSSAMMLFDNISALAHALEDAFFFLRESKPDKVDYPKLADLVLAGIDFIKNEVEKIKSGAEADGDVDELKSGVQQLLADLKNHGGAPETITTTRPVEDQKYYIGPQKEAQSKEYYQARVFFQDGCQMENIRAYTVVHGLKALADEIAYSPHNIIDDDGTADLIGKEGFLVTFSTRKSDEEVREYFNRTIFLKELDLAKVQDNPFKSENGEQAAAQAKAPAAVGCEDREQANAPQSMVSVHVTKLDRLMDLMGELVIAEAMVTQNTDLKDLELDNFQKAARLLGKITGELQDIVMSVRMVPLATTFLKMQRVVRDMCKKLDKQVELELIGEETEVDKNIIERISDPLMHLIRNAVDHGIEPAGEREAKGKRPAGQITLEARNAGSDVLIVLRDDGRGLDKEKILARARENGLVQKNESELSAKEIYSFIFLPGFSTKERVTEFSGRGVGMDVVTKNIASVGGSVYVDSEQGAGTTITLKIPLTLAIVDGMTIRVGNARYTLPITSIRESFKPRREDIITDPDGNEMIMVRGNCYPVLRLHRLFNVKEAASEFTDGIMVMVDSDSDSLCVFADELIGEQQVVVKALPNYIKSLRRVEGLAGCTLLGDGSISLILDVGGMVNMGYRQGAH
ncbi:chemotaxis protein CheW [Anaeroselena agilis]|uniref:Chemotaxis protein CheA n=1 Tax=Anaeroselena agilis TaxID=3063788 RepID=A0ABU3NXX1_9FIRM|nr:chemotaxis protein CheA [Selenomonadales bacterium 4137-cl]